MAVATQQDRIILSFHQVGRRVVVEPENNDKFVTTAREAAAACQRHQEIKAFVAQLRKVMNRLASWIVAHPSDIQGAFLTVRDGGLLFLLIRNSVPYNGGLETALTKLDLEIANSDEFDLLQLNALALPKSSDVSYRTFLVADQTWTFEGWQTRTRT